MFRVLNPNKRFCALSLLSSILSSPALLKRAFYYTHTHTHKMTSALVSSSSRASTTARSHGRPFHRKSSGIKTTKRYAQKILSRFAIFSFSFSSRFPANRRLTDGANFLSLFYSLISIHRRISITPRAENEGDSASTTTPAASAAPKLVPSNAASIKVHERIRLEKFCFFCFSRSKSFFFFVPLSLGGDRVSLSLLLSQIYNSRTTKVRRTS